MKNIIVNLLRKTNGYISIETIVIAGLVIGIGSGLIYKMTCSTDSLTTQSAQKLNLVYKIN